MLDKIIKMKYHDSYMTDSNVISFTSDHFYITLGKRIEIAPCWPIGQGHHRAYDFNE